MRRPLAVIVLFGGLTLLFTYPLWTAPDRLVTSPGDPRLNAWILAWDAHALGDGVPLFDANIFYPHQGALAFSENLVGLAPLVAPLNWLSEPILAYNLVLLVGLAASGMLMACWTRRLTGSWIGGVIAGVVWAFAPTRTDQLHHVQLIAVLGIPAGLWAGTVYLQERKHGLLLAAGLLLGWQYTTGIHASLVTFPLILLFFVLAWRDRPDPRPGETRRALIEGGAAAVFAAIPILAVSLPYLTARAEEGFVRSTAEMAAFSAAPTGFLAAGWANRNPLMVLLSRTFGGHEANHFLGVTALLLVGLAVAASLRDGRRDAPEEPDWRGRIARLSGWIALVAAAIHVAGILLVHAGLDDTLPGQLLIHFSWRADPAVWLAVAGTVWAFSRRQRNGVGGRTVPLIPLLWCAILGYLLALGMEVRALGVDLGNGPFRLLYDWALPYRSLRAPGRFGLAYLLFLAPVAGTGAVTLARSLCPRLGARAAAAATLCLLLPALLWEYRTWPLPAVDGRPAHIEVYQALARLPGSGAVLHVPVLPRGRPASATEYLMGSTLHWRPVVNGYSGFIPASNVRLATLPPDEPAFWWLVRQQFPVRYVVVHRDLLHRPECRRLLRRLRAPGSGYELRERVAEAVIFERVPQAVAARDANVP